MGRETTLTIKFDLEKTHDNHDLEAILEYHWIRGTLRAFNEYLLERVDNDAGQMSEDEHKEACNIQKEFIRLCEKYEVLKYLE